MNSRAATWERRFEVPMLVASLLVIPTLVIEHSHASDHVKLAGSITNWVIWLAFVLEAVVMLAVVSDQRRWLREHPVEVVVVLLTPPFLLAAFQPVRALRLLRPLRLLRLAPLARQLFSVDGVRYAALLSFVVVLASGEAFASVEPDKTFGDGVYWATNTMTTVGFGGAPTTSTGKFLAVAVMLAGVGFVAIITGAIAQRFLAETVEEVAQEVVDSEADLLATVRDIRSRLDLLERALRDRSTA
jgi:voltage-gated potassium channel